MKIGYLIKEGIKNVFVNRLMTVASMGVLICCMLLMGASVLVSENVSAMLNEVEEQNVIMVFMNDDATEQQVKSTTDSIKKISSVKSVEFISKDEAWQNQLKNMDEAQKKFFEVYADKSPLPDTLKVTVEDMAQFDSTVESIKKVDNIQNVRENSQLAQKLAKIRQAIAIVSIVVVAALGAVSLFIISNTVRISMFSRKLEISIMKSVGATDGFVRTPFMVEGAIIGILSAAIAEFLVYGVYVFATKELDSILSIFSTGFIDFWNTDIWWILLVAFIGLGLITGVLGSMFSMNKYLRHEGSELNGIA